jgi:hypothetical protein
MERYMLHILAISKIDSPKLGGLKNEEVIGMAFIDPNFPVPKLVSCECGSLDFREVDIAPSIFEKNALERVPQLEAVMCDACATILAVIVDASHQRESEGELC